MRSFAEGRYESWPRRMPSAWASISRTSDWSSHFDIPGSLEAYYQEVGRAGRDGRPAACALLFHERDLATQEYFIDQASKDSDGTARAERMKTLLQEMLGYVSVSTCRQLAILEYFSDEAELALGPCGLCDRCLAPAQQPGRSISHETEVSEKAILETVSWCMGRFGMGRIVDILRGSRSKALLASGAEQCPTYGIGRAQTKPVVTRLVKNLIRLRVSSHRGYRVSHSRIDVARGERYCKGFVRWRCHRERNLRPMYR